MIYCIDTSSLLAAWNERYPVRNVPQFWQRLDRLISDGRITSPIEVREEIKKREDGLAEWLNSRINLFQELEEDIQIATTEILSRFPWLTKGITGRQIADPFVIALARARNCTVITEEGPGSENRPRIPFVCQHYTIPCINLLGLIQGEDWII